MGLKALDLNALADRTGNLYESVVILSKRARQIATYAKADLDDKLQYFEGFESDIEDGRMNEEQARISIDFEMKPKAPEVAVDEFVNDEIYYRRPGDIVDG